MERCGQIKLKSFNFRWKLAASFALVFFATPLVFAGTFPAFGPKTYVREKGKPQRIEDTFAILNPNTQYALHIEAQEVDEDHDKDSDEGDPHARARILVNGREIVDFDDFENHDDRDEHDRKRAENPVLVIEKPVQLLGSNKISVEVQGRRGTSVTVSFPAFMMSGSSWPSYG